jgi:glycolate oxidase FAD binding subunit
MADTIKPHGAAEVREAIQSAIADGRTLEIVGHGTKRAIGRAAQWDVALDLSGLSGITLYEPRELVLSARAGTPLAEIEAALAQNRQHLAFEPADYGPLLGAESGRGTLGGVLAANLSGPRRLAAGAARDHFLGFSAVSGRGESFKSGGRVVKNVTGYDLSKLAAGSFGTLAALTDVTVKVLPRPETEESLVIFGLDEPTAVAALSRAMGSTAEVTGAAHLPARPASRTIVASLSGDRSVTVLRLEGVLPSILSRQHVLEKLLKPFGELSVLSEGPSRALWRAIRDVAPFAAAVTGADRPLWRISTAPTRGFELAGEIARQSGIETLYDWAGGLVWVLLPMSEDAGNGIVRAAVAAHGGHATLIRAPAAIRAAVPVFQPGDPVTAMLTRRIKQNFDPNGVLNPGRMYAGV